MHLITFQQRRHLRASIPLFGLLFAIFTLFFCLICLDLLHGRTSLVSSLVGNTANGLWVFYLAATLGGFFASMLCWWVIIVLPWKFWSTCPRPITFLMGALVGLASTLFAHPLMWLFWMLYDVPFGNFLSPSPSQNSGLSILLLILLWTLLFSFASIMLVGITSYGTMFLIGIVAGMLGVALFFLWQRGTAPAARDASAPPYSSSPHQAGMLVFSPLPDEQPPLYEYPPTPIPPEQINE